MLILVPALMTDHSSEALDTVKDLFSWSFMEVARSIQLEHEAKHFGPGSLRGLSDDERSQRSVGSGGKGHSLLPALPAIPTIAIEDTGDSQSEQGSHKAHSTLLQQAKEADLYRDVNTGDTMTYRNGQIVPSLVEKYGDVGSQVGEDKRSQHSHGTLTNEAHEEGEEDDIDELVNHYRSQSNTTASSSSTPVERKMSRKGMMYKGSTSSLTSLYSTGEEYYGKYPITGDVNFGLDYNFKTNVFQVKIGGCRDLVPIDAKKNKSDPYIKTYLLPDKSKNSKRKTKIKKGTINPNFSENLKYDIAQSELETRTLSVAIWHHDRFGHNMFLGEVLLPLDSVQVHNYPVKWHQLKTRVPPTETKPISYKGDIILALMFETHKDEKSGTANGNDMKASRRRKKKAKQIGGTLKVHVKEAKNLTSPRVSGGVNPYVKLYLEPDRSKSGKKKTSVMKNTINPSYEQTLEFANVTEEILKERALEVGVWDGEPIGHHAFLGGVRLGSGTGKSYGRAVDWQDATGIEIQLWDEMLRNHDQWVEASLTLRASFTKEK